ncbi:MAG TPA: hypothetical protein VGM03_03495, partial [Phycisphaerae bacterium]
MIAIVILGLGLVLVASMFPIAWQRARDLNDYTNTTNATDAAEATLRSLCRVTKPVPGPPPTFAVGSLISDFANYNPTAVAPPPAPQILLEALPINWGPSPGTPALVPIGSGQSSHVRPLLLENVNAIYDPGNFYNATMPLTTGAVPVEFPDFNAAWGIVARQVAFADRVVPPLPPLPPASAMQAERDKWLAQLNVSRFAWDVLYKLDVPRAGDDLIKGILAGPDGLANTTATPPSDIQAVPVGSAANGSVVIYPGKDMTLQSVPPAGDDQIGTIPMSPELWQVMPTLAG